MHALLGRYASYAMLSTMKIFIEKRMLEWNWCLEDIFLLLLPNVCCRSFRYNRSVPQNLPETSAPLISESSASEIQSERIVAIPTNSETSYSVISRRMVFLSFIQKRRISSTLQIKYWSHKSSTVTLWHIRQVTDS